MHWAARSLSVRCVKVLLDYQTSFVQDHAGKSVIHFAAEAGSVKIVQKIVGVRPQSVHDIDNAGRTPLHWAVSYNITCTIYSLKWLSKGCLQTQESA